MAAPSVASVGTHLAYSGSRTTTSVPVPSGVTSLATDIVVVGLYFDTNVTVTPPLDFAEVPDSPIVQTTSGQAYVYRVYWRRPSAADSGTYAFTHSSTGTIADAVRISGCVATGNPFDVTNSAASVGSATSTVAVSDTTTLSDELLLWVSSNYAGVLNSTLSGFTEHKDSDGVSIQSKAQAVAGATGSLSATITSSASISWLGVLKPTSAAAAPKGLFFPFC